MTTDLTAKFTGLESQLSTQQTALMGALASANETLGLINTALDTLNNNNATNTRYLLGAIQANSPCAPCPTPSVVIPTVPTTPVTVDDTLCKRDQAMLHMLQAVCAALDDLMSLNVTAAWTLINDVYSQIIATLGAGDTMPLPSFPEAVGIAGNYFSFAAARLFSGETLSDDLAGILLDARDAIFSAGDAAAAQSAYNAVVDASSMSSAGKFMLKAIAYNALWTYFFDPASMPNLTGLDGSVCGLVPTGCLSLSSVPYTSDVPSSANGIAINIVGFSRQGTLNTTGGEFHFTPAVIYSGDLIGWTWQVITPSVTVRFQHRVEPYTDAAILSEETQDSTATSPLLITLHTGTFIFFASAPFTISLCPPA